MIKVSDILIGNIDKIENLRNSFQNIPKLDPTQRWTKDEKTASSGSLSSFSVPFREKTRGKAEKFDTLKISHRCHKRNVSKLLICVPKTRIPTLAHLWRDQLRYSQFKVLKMKSHKFRYNIAHKLKEISLSYVEAVF